MTAANVDRAASATKLTGVTFTALAIPLALFGAKPLDLSLAGTTIRGQLDDYAIEYLGAAAVASLGLGLSRLGKGVGIAQTSATPSSSMSVQAPQSSLSNASVLTEEALRASGLHMFLEDDSAPLVAQSQSIPEESSASAQIESAPQTRPDAGRPASDASGEHAEALPTPQAAVAPSPVSQPHAPVAQPQQVFAIQPQVGIATSATALGHGFVATTTPAVSAATYAPAAVQTGLASNQPSQSPAQAAPTSSAATDSLASIVAEVQSIVEQISVHAQHAGVNAVEVPQSAAHASASRSAQVATLPLGTSVASAQVSRHQPSSYPAKGYSTNSYQVRSYQTSGPKVSAGLDTPTLPAAQAYVSFARPQATAESPSAHRFSAELAALEQVYQVREQMQQLMGQLDLVQANLEQTVYSAQRLVPLRAAQSAPSYTVSAVEPVRASVA